METLTIRAVTPESAQSLYAALRTFRSELVESDDGCRVEIQLGAGEREMVEVLNAIEIYVTERNTEPAKVELSGHTYAVYPAR